MPKAEAKKSKTVEVEIFHNELRQLLEDMQVTIKGKDGVALKLVLSKDARALAADLEIPEDEDEEDDEDDADEDGDEDIDDDEEEEKEAEEEVK